MKVEVKNTEEQNTVDWSKTPQLVESNNLIILTDGGSTFENRDDLFSGTILKSNANNNYKTGCYSDDFYKSSFKPFKGAITLQND